MKKIVIPILIAISTMGTAFADITAQSGVYIGGGLGWSFPAAPNVDQVKNTNKAQAISKANHNYTFQGTLGYNYAFTTHWMAGLEANYLYMGQTTYYYPFNIVSTTAQNSGIQIMATGTYVHSSGFNEFAKVGAVYEDTKMTDSIYYFFPGGLQYVDSGGAHTGFLPAAALGVGYMPIQDLNIALQYEHIFGGDWANPSQINQPMTQDVVTIGITYTFPNFPR
jgi:opacity protein-like surface antigen